MGIWGYTEPLKFPRVSFLVDFLLFFYLKCFNLCVVKVRVNFSRPPPHLPPIQRRPPVRGLLAKQGQHPATATSADTAIKARPGTTGTTRRAATSRATVFNPLTYKVRTPFGKAKFGEISQKTFSGVKT